MTNKLAKGFSLVEVALIMALLAILVTFALPAFQDYVGKSEETVEGYIISTLEEGLNNMYALRMATGTAHQGNDFPVDPFISLDVKSHYVPFSQFDWQTKNRWSYQPTNESPEAGSGYILHTRSNGTTYYITYTYQNSTTSGVISSFQIANPVDGSKNMTVKEQN